MKDAALDFHNRTTEKAKAPKVTELRIKPSRAADRKEVAAGYQITAEKRKKEASGRKMIQTYTIFQSARMLCLCFASFDKS